jgi:protoporphyrin/coproporphyrin ferrochelatase
MTDSPKPRRVCVFLLQLGGPASQDTIEPFLANLFEDVLPLPHWLRPRVARLIARRRTPKVAPLYAELGGGSPILPNTEAQATALEATLKARGFDARVLIAMRYSPPRASDALEEARRHWSDALWVALPPYPQYSFATTRSSLEELTAQLTTPEQERLLVLNAYPADAGYLDAVTATVRETLEQVPSTLIAETHVVFSAHGLPMKLVREGDPYPDHVRQSVAGVMERLRVSNPHHLAFQSRVGPVKWLEPSTIDTLERLGRQGVRSVVVVPIAFVSEHIETLHELDIQLREIAKEAGIADFRRAPTPAARPAFIAALAELVDHTVPRD